MGIFTDTEPDVNATMVANAFPMPPTANNLFFNVQGRGRVKSDKYRHYERDVAIWGMQNHSLVQEMRTLIAKRPHDMALKLVAKLKFNRKSILTKQDKAKKMDLDNRMKAMVDCFCKVLCTDDAEIWHLESSKNLTDGPEEVQLTLSLTKMF